MGSAGVDGWSNARHGIGNFALVALEGKSMTLVRIVISSSGNDWGPDGGFAPGTVMPAIVGKSTSIVNSIAVNIHHV